jgi:hypothetical protein
VLAIGLDPNCADLSAFPHLSPDLVRSYIDDELERLRVHGYAVGSCLIDPGATPEEAVEDALGARHYDCVVIGAGLRQPASQLVLFEKVINLVHTLAPQARICFNTCPADTIEAVRRWI